MKKLLALFIVLLSSISAQSQIGIGGEPRFLSNFDLNKNIPTVVFSKVNVARLIDEDKVTDLNKDVPWRFGIPVNCAISTETHGKWSQTVEGQIWHLEITAADAKSINLNYNLFDIPEGARFYIYGKNSREQLGAFTHNNASVDKQFATTLIHDDEIILEYFEPDHAEFNGKIQISSMVYGYRNIDKSSMDFGESGNCNVNIKCHPDWAEEAASVAMILTSNNSRICSGALVNNTREDRKPFFLTANHCNPSSTNIFMFNYESPQCNLDIDGSTSQSIFGCEILAKDSPSDFALLLLNSEPPSSFNVSFAGWSAKLIAAQSSVGIHHPSGDVKKISINNKNLIPDGDDPDTHWRVPYWDKGTTEGGSSGSPLFDQNRRIVGQLHRGFASCGNAEYDSYGGFFYSWDHNPDSSKQIKHWLDPDDTGIKQLDILSNLEPSLNLDLSLIAVNNVQSFVCENSIKPELNIRNFGQTAIDSIRFMCILNEDTTYKSHRFVPSLTSLKYRDLPLDSIDLTSLGTNYYNIKFELLSVNGQSDNNSSNDTTSLSFTFNRTPKPSELIIKFDDWPGELSWEIRDKNNPNILIESFLSGGKNETKQRSICTYDGCFTLDLFDSQGDGFCCDWGQGSFAIVYKEDTLVLDTNFSGTTVQYEFCVNDIGLEELKSHKLSIFPNPSNGIFQLDITNFHLAQNITLLNAQGAIIRSLPLSKQQDISSVDEGLYFIVIETKDNQRLSQKVLINR